MRLIDGDAKNLNPETINGINLDTAIKVVENFLSSDECKSPLHAYLCAVRDFAEWYRDELKNAPTAEAVPVVRGEWVLQGENEHDYETSLEEKCSLCGRYVYRYDTQPQDNYCPNCGAKMESEGGV